MQPTGTVWTNLIEEHLGIIPMKFGQNPMSGFREEVFWIKKNYAHTDALTDDEQMTVTIADFEHFVLRWAKNLRIYEKCYPPMTVWIAINEQFPNCQSWSFITVHGQFWSNGLGLWLSDLVNTKESELPVYNETYNMNKRNL